MSETQATQGKRVFNVGTRESPLAMAQAHIVANSLKAHFPEHEFAIHGMTTTGDRDQKTALYSFGSKGLWTSQLEERLVNKELDLVVHCLKDMPTALPEGCVIGCVTSREDPRDTLVIKKELVEKNGWKSLADLPAGSVIGTSSVRRIAQLVRRYPTLKFKDHRGNIQTRLRKLEEDPALTGIILAAAGLQRMDLDHHISQFLEKDTGGILWAVGQGALAVECRADDEAVLKILKTVEDEKTALECEVERSVMRALEGGCSVPIGVETKWMDGKLRMRATVVSVRGDEGVETEMTEAITTIEAADDFGKWVAKDLVDRGAGKILDAIVASRQVPDTIK
ncbi:porphobilinogen deaminase, dipyromethane cofactor binding domain-containing protein [Ilyonectria sp. MPI-CAGE-AT-0026]|nr:porphobilinogen deaminase, dipyromethane cofactor binding domain-containing protein [Ilyonectria sp. MPI-CAGE-AT-0026]